MNPIPPLPPRKDMAGATSSVAPPVALLTRTGSKPLAVRVAVSFFQRFRGLMLSPQLAPDEGLLLPGCTSVHTMFMRYPIDVLYLDATGLVLKCVPVLKPWRASASNAGRRCQTSAAHTLELAAGTIARLNVACGDRVEHPLLLVRAKASAAVRRKFRQGGVALIEMAVVGPILTMLGLTLVQYGMLFFAKNQINHGSFMAARAGSVGNANLSAVRSAYEQALVPMYGGGETVAERAESLVKAKADVSLNTRIELLNPTKESFSDFNDPALQAKLNTGSKQVISNRNLAFRAPTVGTASGQTVQDANLIKLRITHGYQPVVPIVASVYKVYLKYFDAKTDAFNTRLIEEGRIPIVTHVTMQMQSDPIEPDNPVSMPGTGNGGNPTNPGDPPTSPSDAGPPPDCALGGCSTTTPIFGGTCPAPYQSNLNADTLFAFDSSTLQPGGIQALDTLIARVRELNLNIDTIKVTGHTDPLGTAAHNLALSKARAQAVLNYLHSKGLKADNVDVQGVGSNALVKLQSECQNMGDAEQKACFAPNRRVVVDIIPK